MARKVAGASFVGTALESYDFYVFGTAAALILNRIFFPDVDPLIGVLLSFLSLGIGFIARPVGAVLFGHIGDRIGRKKSLIWTIVLMGTATGVIGLLPDYNTIGLWAPALLVTLRLLQGLAVGGEWGGAILIATEHAEPRKRALYAAIPQIGSPVGTIMVTGTFLLLTQVSPETMEAGLWRVPFLLAFPFMAIALYLRFAIEETPVFKDVAEHHSVPRVPVLEVLAHPARCPSLIACRRIAAGHRLLLPDDHLHPGLRHRPAGPVSDHRAQRGAGGLGAAAGHHSGLRLAGHQDRFGADGCRRRRGHAADFLPAVLGDQHRRPDHCTSWPSCSAASPRPLPGRPWAG